MNLLEYKETDARNRVAQSTRIASHKRPGSADNPTIIEQTRQYIHDFDRLVETTTSAQELYDNIVVGI
jgi:hypothetical protein